MKHLKYYEEYLQIEEMKEMEQMNEGLFSSRLQKAWERMDTYSLTRYIIQSWKKSYTIEKGFKKIKINLSDLTKEDWERWAQICKKHNNDYKKVIEEVKNDEKLNKINDYIIHRAYESNAAKTPPPHVYGREYAPPPSKKEFDAVEAVNNAFKRISS